MDLVVLALAKKGAKAYTDNAINSLPKGVVYRGSVNYYVDLPNDAALGDCYTVTYKGSTGAEPFGAEYVWGLNTVTNIREWIKIGEEIDLSGLQTEITSNNKLASDLVDDTNSGNKFTNTSEKTTWNAKYDKPIDGIPKTDLTSAVQTSLDKADNALPASRMVTLTQAQYDALETKDSDTYYHIPEEE